MKGAVEIGEISQRVTKIGRTAEDSPGTATQLEAELHTELLQWMVNDPHANVPIWLRDLAKEALKTKYFGFKRVWYTE